MRWRWRSSAAGRMKRGWLIPSGAARTPASLTSGFWVGTASPGAGAGGPTAGTTPPLESFCASLKKERVHDADFATRAEAPAALFEYLEVFYNGQRRHSALGYVSPAAYEQSAYSVSGNSLGRPGLPVTLGKSSTSGMICRWSLALRRRADGQRHPVPVHPQRVFRAFFPAVHGAGAGRCAAAEGAPDDGSDADQVRVELAGLAQPAQQVGVEPVPTTPFLPAWEERWPARPAAQRGGPIFPAAGGGQHEPQDLDDAPVVERRTPAPRADRPLGRQMVCRQFQERLGHSGVGQDRCLPRGAITCQQSSGVPR